MSTCIEKNIKAVLICHLVNQLVFIIYQMEVKYNIDVEYRFVSCPHSDYAGFCDPISRLPRTLSNPSPLLAILIQVNICLRDANVYTYLIILGNLDVRITLIVYWK